ncbi:hypothetical protein HF086_006831 [Spodoptera exigua]|uniref:Glucose-methanol-choline oxidoreductase N-terminal domain-containing protein n=1 Tax=Spodoptera exigua TaxID=7107 RepID=A0A922M1N0_SPOEX|nr:hypothetical protein HF086_006831 [Spodoptera exigua]
MSCRRARTCRDKYKDGHKVTCVTKEWSNNRRWSYLIEDADNMCYAVGGCAGAGPAASYVAAALQFFAASQCLLQESYPRHAHVTNGSQYDFIVVGGGTAGSALAARLAEEDRFSVLLLEAGPNPPVESIIPGLRQTLKETPYDWNFTTVDDGVTSQALASHVQRQPRGKMLGGSGSLNDMVYARGHPQDYYEWADIAGDVWNWTNVLDYFKKTEHMTDSNIVGNEELMQYHGTGGAIEVAGAHYPHSPNSKMMQAFQELGFAAVDDMTYPYKIGVGKFSHTVRAGRRDSSLTAMLNKVKSRKLHVLKNTFATKILFEGNKAVGILADSDGRELHVYAKHEVIVSAGTFNTPKLLLLSGVGPSHILNQFGIDVVQDLPVGQGLQDHVMFLNFMTAHRGTCELKESDGYFNVVKYLYNGSGTLSYSDSIGAYLPQKDKDANIPYFAIYPSCVPAGQLTSKLCMQGIGFTNEICGKLQKENELHELIVAAVVLLKPQSRGNVTLKSVHPDVDPAIYSGTFDDEADLEGFPEAIEKALSLVNTTHFKKLGARVVDLTPESCVGLQGAARKRCSVRALALAAWHAVGTARLGAVLDAELRVRGLQGLRVADASVMPTMVRGNTNAPVVMIAEMAADFIKNQYGDK